MAAKPISSKPISATPSTQSLTAPPFDACLPINLVGPFQQTMFLGCSIASFSASVGWSSQASELTVQLVQDPCANSAGKLYYDNLLNFDKSDPITYFRFTKEIENIKTRL